MGNTATLFQGLWLAWIVYWLISARGTKRTASRPKLRFAYIWLLVILAWAVAAHLHPHFFSRRLFPPDGIRAPVCLAVAALGLGFSIWARRVLGSNWSSTPVIKEGHELIRVGPYRWVRHPIYTGLLVALAATFAARGHVGDACLLALVILGLVWKLRIEESLMMQNFPEAYPEYRKQTKALIPFVI
jgi:protein-S-isoprenylcysteine O-methyltransferase Ste14